MTINLALFTAFALATVRATVFLALCPPFNSRAISGRIKAMLGAALGFACMGRVGPIEQSDVFLFELLIQASSAFLWRSWCASSSRHSRWPVRS